MGPIRAQRHVARPPTELYAQLADLRTHWRLAGPWVQPLELRADGGVVRVRGPLGLRRTIHTALTDARSPHCVAGEASSGATRAVIRWGLQADGDGTMVTLEAQVRAAGRLDRAMLALGGRWWMKRRFAATLQRLG